MATTRVTFGEWLPDQPGVIGALTTAKTAIHAPWAMVRFRMKKITRTPLVRI